MLMNEYGSVQQHLEPAHVRDLVIPIPDDWSAASSLIARGREFMRSKETADLAMDSVRRNGFDQGIAGFLKELLRSSELTSASEGE